MKAALAIAAAQVHAYRVALQAALPISVMGLLWLEYTRYPPAVRVVIGVVAATCFQLCLALVLGANAVSSDLAERRLGFFLARPVPPLAYWASRLLAAFFVAYVTGWLLLLLGLLTGSYVETEQLLGMMAHGTDGLAGVFATAFFVALAGAAAGAARSRSGLLIVDVVMLGTTAVALLLVVGVTWETGTSWVVQKYATPWLRGVALLVLLCAGAAQVSLGRLDMRRGHALLSTILWTGLLACVLGLHLFSRSVAGATPAELRWPFPIFVDAPRSGTHVLLYGASARWDQLYWPAFLLDAQGGFVRLGGNPGTRGFAWSEDGRHLAFSREAFPPFEVLANARLLRSVPGAPSLWVAGTQEPGAAPTRLAATGLFDRVRALSPSGKRVLTVSLGNSKSVVDVESGRTLSRIDDRTSWSHARFLGETRVRALRQGGGQGRVVDWDLSRGSLTERGAIAFEHGQSTRLVPTDDWQRVLRFDATGLFLHDVDGRLVAMLVDRWSGRSRAAGGLSEGRFGSIEEEPDGLRLRVFDSLGKRGAEAHFKGRLPVIVGGESAPGLLALGVGGGTLFVDLATGDVARREPGLKPALRSWLKGDALSPEPGSFATRLFTNDTGIVLLDPENGTRKVLVQPRTR